MVKPELQPLRVPGGWRVDVNALQELDPSPETIDWFYGSILFSAIHRHLGLELHVHWEAEGDPSGSYVLQRYRLQFEKNADRAIAGYLVDEQRIADRRRLVERMENYMKLSEWN